jgi:hypothetical protein
MLKCTWNPGRKYWMSTAEQVLEIIPYGVNAQLRTDGESNFVLLMSFTKGVKRVGIGNIKFIGLRENWVLEKQIIYPPYLIVIPQIGLQSLKR